MFVYFVFVTVAGKLFNLDAEMLPVGLDSEESSISFLILIDFLYEQLLFAVLGLLMAC